MPRARKGKILFDASRCVGCGNCQKICFHNVWLWNEEEHHMEPKYMDDCVACYQCELTCPNKCMEVTPPDIRYYDALVRFNDDDRYREVYKRI